MSNKRHEDFYFSVRSDTYSSSETGHDGLRSATEYEEDYAFAARSAGEFYPRLSRPSLGRIELLCDLFARMLVLLLPTLLLVHTYQARREQGSTTS